MSYFLFMQEQRKVVPGWSNKSNHELQALCDPLWRKLDKSEKEKYKKMKKEHREKERQADEVRFASVMHTDIRTKVLVGQVDKPDIVWVTRVKEMEVVQKQLSKIAMVPLELVTVGTVAACKFREDGVVYRCQVAAEHEDDMVMVRYMEFGNMEKVNKVELCHLPSSLCKVVSMAVRVRVGGMEGVKDNEKNRAKVEKKLDVDDLEVTLNREGFATFFTNGKCISFKGSKIKLEESSQPQKICTEKLVVASLPTGVDKESVVKVGEKLELLVSEVIGGYPPTCEAVDEIEPRQQNEIANEVAKVKNVKIINTVEVLDLRTVVKKEDCVDVQIVFDGSNVIELVDHDVMVGDGIVEVKIEETFITENLKKKAVERLVVFEGGEDFNNNRQKRVFSTTSASLDGSIGKSSSGISLGGEADSGIGVSVTTESVIKGKIEQIIPDGTPEVSQVVDDSNRKLRNCNQLKLESVFDNNYEAGRPDEGHLAKEEVVVSSKISPVEKRLLVIRKETANKKSHVGAVVAAKWETDGVWRQGTVHEVVGDMAYVVSREQLVRATKVRVDQLRHADIPVEVLNMLEDELVTDLKDKTVQEESTTDSGDSFQGVFEADQEEVDQKCFSDEFEDLLDLLPRVDIVTLTSPSYSDLLSSLVTLVPSLPVSQLDRLMEDMIGHDLLVPASLHPESCPLASVLVKQIMMINSDMKGKVVNTLAINADKMLGSMWGKIVLKSLKGFV